MFRSKKNVINQKVADAPVRPASYGMNSSDEKLREEIKALVGERNSQVNRLFYMMIEMFFIFAIPAALAFWGGKSLDLRFDTGRTWLFSLLILAFISSWALIIVRVRTVSKKLKVYDLKIKELKEKEREDV